jgi:hypothetical protein
VDRFDRVFDLIDGCVDRFDRVFDPGDGWEDRFDPTFASQVGESLFQSLDLTFLTSR